MKYSKRSKETEVYIRVPRTTRTHEDIESRTLSRTLSHPSCYSNNLLTYKLDSEFLEFTSVLFVFLFGFVSGPSYSPGRYDPLYFPEPRDLSLTSYPSPPFLLNTSTHLTQTYQELTVYSFKLQTGGKNFESPRWLLITIPLIMCIVPDLKSFLNLNSHLLFDSDSILRPSK